MVQDRWNFPLGHPKRGEGVAAARSVIWVTQSHAPERFQRCLESVVAVELVVSCAEPGDRTQPWIEALLWYVASENTRLLESQRFTGGADLRVWLKAIVAEHGRGNINVRWTDKLKANFALSHLIAVCLDVPVSSLL
jgi:hypothetical protein